MKRIGIDLTEEEHQSVKVICAKGKISIRDFCVEAINEKIGAKICTKRGKN